VIKTAAYFPSQCAKNSVPVMQALLTGLDCHGISTVADSLDADVAIVWSVLWSGRMAANQAIWSHYQAQGRPVIVVDVGALHRGQTWKIALNNINANGYYGHTEHLDWDRPARLGVSLTNCSGIDPSIVISAQHVRSLQVSDINSMEDWLVQQAQRLRAVTDRPIVIRPHPRSALNSTRLIGLPNNVTIQRPQLVANTYDSYNLPLDCHAMVNYNSGPGIQAALAGVRPIVDQTSLAWPVSIQISDIELPYQVDRDQWLVEICHTEYTLKEIQEGTWIKRLAL
jgi:hypothetical protein